MLDPVELMSGRIGQGAGRDQVTRIKVREIGCLGALSIGATYGVATSAVLTEHPLASCNVGAAGRLCALPLSLCRAPRGKVCRALRHHFEGHVCMLRTAKLRTLPTVNTGVIRLDPLLVGLTGDGLGLARQLRHPECVDHVGAS